MSDITGGFISALGTAVGAGIEAKTQNTINKRNVESTEEINAINNAMAQQENIIQRSREDNAIQREQADLKAAGINPLMAGRTGGAASSAGQIIQNIAPRQEASKIGTQIGETGQRLIDSAQTIAETKRTLAQTETEKQTKLGIMAQKDLNNAKTETEKKEAIKVGKTIALLQQQTWLTELMKHKTAVETREIVERARLAVQNTTIAEINAEWLTREKQMEILGEGIDVIKGAINPLNINRIKK